MRAVAFADRRGRQLMSCLLPPATCGPTLLMAHSGPLTTRRLCLQMTQSGHPNSRRNTALRLTLTLFDVRPAAESVCAESTPAYGPSGAGNLEAARAVSVRGALTSKRCISARDDKEIQANDVR